MAALHLALQRAFGRGFHVRVGSPVALDDTRYGGKYSSVRLLKRNAVVAPLARPRGSASPLFCRS